MNRMTTKTLALAGAFFAAAGAALAQDNAPLIDLLVKKGVVNDQEAEELKAELVKNFVANTSAGKLNLGSSVSEFKLSGDVRLRHQEETKQTQGALTTSEQRRDRFRFRFNGDVLLQKGWGAGFALETGSAADSGNQSFVSGSDDYSIFLARAYISYRYSNELSFVGGKFKNPFYTTDLVWDADINPQGLSETYVVNLGGKSGKDTLEFRAAQIIMSDVAENKGGAAGRDSYLINQQAVYSLYFGANNASSFVIAPGFMASSNSVIGATGNETSFAGNNRYINIITAPGEINFANVAGEGTSLKTYWDFAYNTTGNNQVYKSYGVASTFKSDRTAWLVGIGYNKGTGKVQGDYGVKLDYREIGIGSIDPNISDSDFAFGNLNQKGFKLAATYNLTDFASFNAAYFYTTDKQGTLSNAVAALDHSQILQLDLVVKF
jgi:polyhydroxyalkanoate synthesis regulator phasin